MTQRLDKLKTDNDKVRGPNSKLVTNGSEAQNENTVARTKLGVYSAPKYQSRIRKDNLV